MSDIARRPMPALKPLDPGLSAEVLEWADELRSIWTATGLSLNQFTCLYGPIDKGTVSRYLNGQRVPRDRWFLDKLLAIQTDNGNPLTPAVREHLTMLHLRALQVAHPHEYRVRLVNDELEIALTGKLEAERYARVLEEQLAERNRQIQELTDDKGRLRVAWDADREAMQADFERLTRDIDDITGQLRWARERTAEAEQSCQHLEYLLEQLDDHPGAHEDSDGLRLSILARELNTPLTSVKGFTATMLAKWSKFTDDQKRVMLETVFADADNITRIVAGMMDASMIRSGRMEIHRQLIDLPEHARKIIAGRVAAGDAEDRFRLEIRDGLPETWLDPDKIDQVLSELVANAVRHGAGIITIVVQPAYLDDDAAASMPVSDLGAPDAAAISVLDQGDGISPDIAPKVFEEFWRSKPRGGQGLGLYIVKGLAEALGGAISVHHAPGGGAEFRFIVPAGTGPVQIPERRQDSDE